MKTRRDFIKDLGNGALFLAAAGFLGWGAASRGPNANQAGMWSLPDSKEEPEAWQGTAGVDETKKESSSEQGQFDLESKLAGFADNVFQVGINCVDTSPNYQTPAAGGLLAYIEMGHDKNHVLENRNPADAVAYLAWDSTISNFHPLQKGDVPGYLGSGVIQLTRHQLTPGELKEKGVPVRDISVVSISVPGGSYAFSNKGTGFGFDNPNAAPAWAMHEFLREFLDTYGVKGPKIVTAFTHPDCLHFGMNEGKRRFKYLTHNLSHRTYEVSEYANVEQARKLEGVAEMRRQLEPQGIQVFHYKPEYDPRPVGVVNALQKMHVGLEPELH